MKNIKVSVLLIASYAAILFGLVVVLGFSFTRMSDINDQSTVISENWLPSVKVIERLKAQVADIRNIEVQHILSDTPEKKRAIEEAADKSKQAIGESIAQYEAMMPTEEEKKLLDAFQKHAQSYLKMEHEVFRLSNEGQEQAALTLFLGENANIYRQIFVLLEKISDFNSQGAMLANQRADVVYDQSITLLNIVATLVVLFTIFIAFYITRTLTQQVSNIQYGMTRLSDGDLSVRLDNVSQSELGRLAGYFNKTVEQLSATVNEIQEAATQLASTSEELSTVTEKSTQDIYLQNEQLEMAVSAVNEMTSAVEEVARNAVATSKDSDAADEKASLGRDQVQQTIQTIQSLLSELHITTDGVNGLANQVKGIGSVLDVIRDIAEQTNLLALNAAIEAARAGETGRGFAVVADEVRALAHRTQESTKDIEAMIQSIQGGTTNTVNAMQRSHDKANATLTIANQSGNALQEITESVSRINDQNVAIASSAEEQALVAREVDKNLLVIRDIANEAVAGANQSSAASLALARLAENLNGLTNRFKL